MLTTWNLRSEDPIVDKFVAHVFPCFHENPPQIGRTLGAHVCPADSSRQSYVDVHVLQPRHPQEFEEHPLSMLDPEMTHIEILLRGTKQNVLWRIIVFMFSLDILSNMKKSDSQEKKLYIICIFSPPDFYALIPPSLWHSLCIDSGWGFRWCQWVRRTAACTWSLRATMSSWKPRRIRDICESCHRVRVAQHWAAKLGRCVLQDQRWIHVDTVDTWQRLFLFDFTPPKKREWHFLTLSFGKQEWSYTFKAAAMDVDFTIV